MKNRRKKQRIKGTAERPRLSVFRSHQGHYVQIIDDQKGKTLVAVSEKELTNPKKKLTKLEKARKLGEILAKKALKKKIKTVVFDRGPYRYQGRVKALAEGAREGGLKF